MSNLLNGCAANICTITVLDKSGILREFTLDGLRDISMVDGEFSKIAYDRVYSDLTEAHMEFESAMCDPDADFDLHMAKAKRILRKYMSMSYAKYVTLHAGNDPKNLNVFIVLCNHGISCTKLLRKYEVQRF